VISYSYVVINSGNLAISGPISVVDDNVDAPATCPPGDLAPGEALTCTASRTVTEADIDAGSITNTAFASGTDPNGGQVVSPTVELTVPKTVELTMVMTASPSAYSNAGEVIDYRYTVTGSGDQTIIGPISVIDDNVDAPPSCPDGDLAPGESLTCTASRTVTQADVDAGSITNTAFAVGTDQNGGEVVSPTVILTVTGPLPGFELVWSDEFDDWCGEGICSPNPGNWFIQTGYGPNNDGWGNNEWQLYTDSLENVRVENGTLVISALCGSSTPPEERYSQDFEALDASNPAALGLFGDGYQVFGDVWSGDVGTSEFLYNYGPFTAPNGGPAFSAIATGEGGADQGDQYLNIYSDYNNADQTGGGSCIDSGCTINTTVFQEQTIVADDIGLAVTLNFDAKSPFEGGIFDAAIDNGGNFEGSPTSASAFIKTLDPDAGFAATNDVRVDMTDISNTDWNEFSISLDLSDPLLEGQLLQFGFNTVTTEYDDTGVYYDNISFTAAEPAECGVRDGSVTSARIDTSTTFDTIRYGRIVARIKPPVGKAAWPAFWMLGSNFDEVGWPRSGEIDIMEMFNTFGSNERTTHSTLHWCDETIQAPDECSFPEGRVFEGDSLEFEESLGDDFHIFEAVWDPEKIVFFADGRQVFSRDIDPETMEEFTRDFFMILNVAMGGFLGSNNDPPDGTEIWPQTMLVDWVRVYEAVP
jgi:hypothetical protein